MRRLTTWAVSLAALTMTLPANAALITYYRDLGPDVAGSSGTGWARATFDTDAVTMHVEAAFADLTGTTTVAHIHCCTVDPEAGTIGVATYPTTFPGWPVGVTSGTYDGTFDMSLASSYTASFITNFGGGTVEGAFAALLAGLDDGRAYFNIHTSFAPGGEIRGFLRSVSVPEPGSLILLGLGLVAIAVTLRARFRG
jgi:hypothetical protein